MRGQEGRRVGASPYSVGRTRKMRFVANPRRSSGHGAQAPTAPLRRATTETGHRRRPTQYAALRPGTTGHDEQISHCSTTAARPQPEGSCGCVRRSEGSILDRLLPKPLFLVSLLPETPTGGPNISAAMANEGSGTTLRRGSGGGQPSSRASPPESPRGQDPLTPQITSSPEGRFSSRSDRKSHVFECPARSRRAAQPRQLRHGFLRFARCPASTASRWPLRLLWPTS